MAAPSPSTKPSRSRSNGREALVGSSLLVLKAVQQIEAGDAEGMDHAVRAAGEHHVGVAAADDLGGLADGLAAGGAGRQAVGVRPLGVEHAGQVAGRHVGLLLQLDRRVQPFQAGLGEQRQVELAAGQALVIIRAKQSKILLAFAAAQVDAEARGIELGVFEAPSRARLSWRRPAANLVCRPRSFQTSGSSPTSLTSQLRTSAEILVGKLLASKTVV